MATKIPTVAIIGQANVGKSSMFNRLTRARTAIVAKEAGTTRDNVAGKVSYRATSGERQNFGSSTPLDSRPPRTNLKPLSKSKSKTPPTPPTSSSSWSTRPHIHQTPIVSSPKSPPQQKTCHPRDQQNRSTRRTAKRRIFSPRHLLDHPHQR